MTVAVAYVDTVAARKTLRAQIARLELDLALTLAETYPPINVPRPTQHDGPLLLNLEKLERTRDTLAARAVEANRAIATQAAQQAEARARLHAMYAAPNEHRGERITNLELGLRGCTTYQVVPRLLGAWWRVKVSSGCP